GIFIPNYQITSTNSPGRSYIGRGTATFSPTLLLEAGYAYNYGAIVSDPTGLNLKSNSPDVVSAITLPFASTLKRVPSVTISGISTLTGFGEYRDFNRNHSAYVNMTKVSGSHTMKYGVTYYHYNKDENSAGNNVGSFSFNTANGQPTNLGNSTAQRMWANFLLGRASSFSQASVDLRADIISQQVEAFAQDEWRVRRNFTLTYGLRYSYFGQPTDGLGRLTSFLPSAYKAANAPPLTPQGNLVLGTGDPLNGIILNGVTSPFGDAVSNSNKKNFAPRLGFSWDPWSNGKTAVRGGYGLYYDVYSYSQAENDIFTNPPFVQSPSTPATLFTNPAAAGFNISATTPNGIRAMPSVSHQPYVQQISLGVQREITRGWFGDVSYVYTKGTHLVGRLDINEVPLGAAVAQGLVPAGSINTTSNNPILNFARPFRGYGAINSIQTIYGSNYNALQAQLQKRFKGDSLINVSYTWSHGLTDAQQDTSAPQNSYDVRAEYGNSELDRTHVFSANWVYELPFMRSQQGFAGHLIGGWEVSGILAMNAGLPLTITTSGVDPGNQGILGASFSAPRPDMIGDPNGAKTITS